MAEKIIFKPVSKVLTTDVRDENISFSVGKVETAVSIGELLSQRNIP
jgi:hypothetical protein